MSVGMWSSTKSELNSKIHMFSDRRDGWARRIARTNLVQATLFQSGQEAALAGSKSMTHAISLDLLTFGKPELYGDEVDHWKVAMAQ